MSVVWNADGQTVKALEVSGSHSKTPYRSVAIIKENLVQSKVDFPSLTSVGTPAGFQTLRFPNAEGAMF